MDELFITEGERKRICICEICRCEFIDKSRRGNSLVCGSSCARTKDARRKRMERNGGNPLLKRERERQTLEYPFYSPAELFEISKRGESLRADPSIGIDRAAIRYEHGRRTPTAAPKDFGSGYSPNGHKQWRGEYSMKGVEGESGPVITYNLREQPLTESWSEANETIERYIGHAA